MSGPIRTEMLSAQAPRQFQAAVKRAAALLRAGQVVALPTETVYGLAANALDPEAVARIYEAKGRPAHNPIIVHVGSREMARQCVARWPMTARRLAAAFWPGPLTLVLPRSPKIPDVVTAGGPTVGVRWPSHPFIQAVIRECGFPLAAPSANRSNMVSPTSAKHVRQSLGGRIPLIVDGGSSPVGIESAVLDLTVSPPRVLRPGMIHEESLAAVLGRRWFHSDLVTSHEPRGRGRESAQSLPRGNQRRLTLAATSPRRRAKSDAGKGASQRGALRSPGLLRRHYAPQARLLVLAWRDELDLRRQLRGYHAAPAHCHLVAHTVIPARRGFGGVSVIPREPAAFARALYAELHRGDEAGARWIVVEAPPEAVEWRGIADRLRRASAD
jgi:L-threonylcarbamoyladenylate synthase